MCGPPWFSWKVHGKETHTHFLKGNNNMPYPQNPQKTSSFLPNHYIVCYQAKYPTIHVFFC